MLLQIFVLYLMEHCGWGVPDKNFGRQNACLSLIHNRIAHGRYTYGDKLLRFSVLNADNNLIYAH